MSNQSVVQSEAKVCGGYCFQFRRQQVIETVRKVRILRYCFSSGAEREELAVIREVNHCKKRNESNIYREGAGEGLLRRRRQRRGLIGRRSAGGRRTERPTNPAPASDKHQQHPAPHLIYSVELDGERAQRIL